MKNVHAILMTAILALGAVSCKDNNDYETIKEIARISIDSVKIQKDTMDIYSVQEILTYSDYTRGCEAFYGHQYEKDDFDRYVTTYKFKTDGTCTTEGAFASKINFEPQNTGKYTFKFWQGKDSQEQDIWLEKTVVVE
ncbi:MAG: hypothetical protein QM564_09975 [Bergeyella sp.]